MTPPAAPPPRGSALATVGRVIAGALSCAAGVVFLWITWLVVDSRFELTSADPHGYLLIFGTIIAIFTAIVLAAIVPLALAPRRRSVAYLVSLPLFLIVAIALVAMLVTA